MKEINKWKRKIKSIAVEQKTIMCDIVGCGCFQIVTQNVTNMNIKWPIFCIVNEQTMFFFYINIIIFKLNAKCERLNEWMKWNEIKDIFCSPFVLIKNICWIHWLFLLNEERGDHFGVKTEQILYDHYSCYCYEESEEKCNRSAKQ